MTCDTPKKLFQMKNTRRCFNIWPGYQPGFENWNLQKLESKNSCAMFAHLYVLTQVDTSFWCKFPYFWNIEKSFFGVSRVTLRICLVDIRRQSHVLLLLTQKDPYKSSDMTSWHPKVQKWRLMAKILRENMRDMLSLDVCDQANFKYTPKKDFYIFLLFTYFFAPCWNQANS